MFEKLKTLIQKPRIIEKFEELSTKQKIIVVTVLTISALLTYYLGAKSVSEYRYSENTIIVWLLIVRFAVIFAPITVLIFDYFKIYFSSKGFIVKALINLFSICALMILIYIVFAIIIFVLAIVLLVAYASSSSGSSSFSGFSGTSSSSGNNLDAELASEAAERYRRDQDINRFERAANIYESRGLHGGAEAMQRNADRLR